jgi:hypothetical protein
MAWITVADALAALGVAPATTGDSDWLADCVDSANEMAYRRRASSGYIDDPATVPDPAVKLGTVHYACKLYRQRGSVDGTLAAFDDFGHQVETGATWGEILRLWGCNKPVGIY